MSNEQLLYDIYALIEETADPEDGRPWKVAPDVTGRKKGATVFITTPGGQTFRSQIPSARITDQTIQVLNQQLARNHFDIAAARAARTDRMRRAQQESAAVQAKAERARNEALAANRPVPDQAPRRPKKIYPNLSVQSIDVGDLYALELLEAVGDGSSQKRPLSPDNVQRFIDIIRDGLWIPDVICIDWFGYVINGRHRLAAIIEAGITVPCIILWGCDPRMFAVFDTPKVRSGGDTLYAKGLAGADGVNQNRMAAALRMLHGYKRPRLLVVDEEATFKTWSRKRVENTELLALVGLYPGIYTALESAKVLCASGRKDGQAVFMPAPSVTFCYLARERWPECGPALDEFMIAVTLGLKVGPGDPRKGLYNLMVAASASKNTRIPAVKQLALLCKQWNWWLTGRKMKQGVQWRPADEGMPVCVTGEEVTIDLDAVLATAGHDD